jgi:predicted AlkP superfamily pyrophosphatase or phosphodiesterase
MTRFILWSLLCLMGFTAWAQEQAKSEKPYVILISCDGFRYDYVARFQPPNIRGFIEEGVAAASMIASYPTKTFPNHYTIATGLYPENHGLVDNSFYDPERKQEYRIRNREAVEDGSWYGGTPIWVNAEKTASLRPAISLWAQKRIYRAYGLLIISTTKAAHLMKNG